VVNAGARVVLIFFAVACGSEDASIASKTEGAGWEQLIAVDWAVDPGREYSTCSRLTVDRDLTITRFEPMSPRGTHHTVLSTGAPGAPDGPFGCDLFELRTLLFGTGVGSTALTLPEGVVARVRAGEQMMLGLHLFNTTPGRLQGTSGVRALTAAPSAEQIEAEAISVLTQDISLPPGRETVTRASCTFTQESTLFALHPHMHVLGTHMKIVARTEGATRVIHDARFEFGEQTVHPIEPLVVAPGDRLEVECTHRNTTAAVVSYGASSTAEMCAAGVYRYPASRNGSYFCSE
jgi:hypothetical protein